MTIHTMLSRRSTRAVLAVLFVGASACSEPLAPRDVVGFYVAVGSVYAPVVTQTLSYEVLSATVTIDADLVVQREVVRETTLATGAVRVFQQERYMSYEMDGRRVRTSPPPCPYVGCDGIEAMVPSTPDFLVIGDALVTVTREGDGWTYERRPTFVLE